MFCIRIYKMKLFNYRATGVEAGVLPYSHMFFSALKGKSVVSIYRDGVAASRIKTDGIPENKEATFYSVLGTVLIWGKLVNGEEISILYQNQ